MPENETKVHILYRCIAVDWSVVVIIIVVVGGGGGGGGGGSGGFDVEFTILSRTALSTNSTNE